MSDKGLIDYSVYEEYEKLCGEYKKVSEELSEIGKKISEKNKAIKEMESKKRFKYNGKTYRVIYAETIKSCRSIICVDKRNGEFVIVIDSRLTDREKQEELHIMLKRKKCLTYF